jgi:hypothetical protein
VAGMASAAVGGFGEASTADGVAGAAGGISEGGGGLLTPVEGVAGGAATMGGAAGGGAASAWAQTCGAKAAVMNPVSTKLPQRFVLFILCVSHPRDVRIYGLNRVGRSPARSHVGADNHDFACRHRLLCGTRPYRSRVNGMFLRQRTLVNSAATAGCRRLDD